MQGNNLVLEDVKELAELVILNMIDFYGILGQFIKVLVFFVRQQTLLLAPSSSGLGHDPLKVETGVRVSVGLAKYL